MRCRDFPFVPKNVHLKLLHYFAMTLENHPYCICWSERKRQICQLSIFRWECKAWSQTNNYAFMRCDGILSCPVLSCRWINKQYSLSALFLCLLSSPISNLYLRKFLQPSRAGSDTFLDALPLWVVNSFELEAIKPSTMWSCNLVNLSACQLLLWACFLGNKISNCSSLEKEGKRK